MGTVYSTGDIRGQAGDSLTTERVWNVGKAMAESLQQEGAVTVVKGVSAHEQTVHALIEGLLLQGRDVIDGGVGDEQLLAGVIADKQAAGGVLVIHDDLQNIEIITLYDDRAVRITAENGLTELSELVDSGNFVPAAEKGTVTSND